MGNGAWFVLSNYIPLKQEDQSQAEADSVESCGSTANTVLHKFLFNFL